MIADLAAQATIPTPTLSSIAMPRPALHDSYVLDPKKRYLKYEMVWRELHPATGPEMAPP